MPLPIPRPPPLTNATRPSSSPMCQPWPVTDGSRKAVFAALFANLGIAIAKFVGFVITGSAGLLAEAAHSVADTGNQALLLLGGRRARREADAEHPFGYGRERYFWAFVVALVLFSMGGLFALYEGISKLRDPHEVENLRRRHRHPRVRHPPRVVLPAHRVQGGAPPQGQGHVMVDVHPHRQAARAAGGAARGRRCRARPVLRPGRRAARPLHR